MSSAPDRDAGLGARLQVQGFGVLASGPVCWEFRASGAQAFRLQGFRSLGLPEFRM